MQPNNVTIIYMKHFSFLLGLFVAFTSLFVSCSEDEKDSTVCTVTVKSVGHGTVSITRYIGTSADVLIGSLVEVAAPPDDGYAFTGWYTDESETPVSTDPFFEFVAMEDITLTARFAELSANVHAVDLGLSVKWACCNVGATNPEEYGGYYAWGETEEKSDYSPDTYKWYKYDGSDYSITKYCTDSYYGRVDNKTVLDPEDDVAHVKWGSSWRMPTSGEQKELLNECTWKWTELNGVNGYRVTGPNGNSIFLPAAGYRSGAGLGGRGTFGYYWSSSLGYMYSSGYAYYLDFVDDNHYWGLDTRSGGQSVRPVCE